MISRINLEIVTDALEFAFNASESKWVCDQKITPAIAICEAALAEQSEPVARVMYDDDGIKTNNLIDCDLPVGTLLFTHPASNHLDEIAKVLHYPECWDTAAYPALEDAIIEAKAWEHCTNEDCQCPTKETP